MKKILTNFKEMKEGYLSAKTEEQFRAYSFANVTFIFIIYLILHLVSAIIVCNISEIVGVCMVTISLILYVVFESWDKAFSKTIRISAKILDYFFARYGRVVTAKDWKRIKKENKDAYKFIWDKENIGHCYAVSWILALHLEDAKVMYCSVEISADNKTAHAVVVKNNCIYDTNLRRHCDFDEYIKINNAEVYQIFEEEVYCKKSFFDDIRDGFVDWCAERSVYCNPQ